MNEVIRKKEAVHMSVSGKETNKCTFLLITLSSEQNTLIVNFRLKKKK